MSEDVNISLRELLQALAVSPEVKRYEQVRSILDEREDARRVVDDYRRNVYRIQNCPDSSVHLDELNALLAQRDQIRRDPDMREYLEAELEVCRIFQHICSDVMKVADVDISGFEESIGADE